MKMLTKQQLFDKTAIHLVRQGKKSRNKQWCLYRGKDGLKCPVGALITDKEYEKDMEGSNVLDLFDDWKKNLNACGISKRHQRLLKEIQIVHDDCRATNWVKELKEVALLFKLSPVKFLKYVK